ncbi:MAG TPA: hypothetical protein VLK22_02025 [Candidatus Udaeobacter sp.]|nr:hypothetical protein [Candidatus Udaeobacter sp.]
MQKLTVTRVGNGPLANLIGATALVSTEDGACKEIVGTMDAARGFLGDLVTNGRTGGDEAMSAEKLLREMGVREDLQSLRDRCHQLTPDSSEYGFEMCTSEIAQRIPHGWITHRGRRITNAIGHFEGLYQLCIDTVSSDPRMTANDGLTILQQSAGINLTHEELARAAATTIRTVSIFVISSMQVDD